MSDRNAISFLIEPAWSTVREAMGKTEIFLANCGKSGDLIPATIMCVSELIENAVKYGSPHEKITCQLGLDDSRIWLEVANNVAGEHDVASVIEVIGKLKSGESPKTLYCNRLREVLEADRPEASRLGLYRIAYEGGFSLDCTFSENRLTVKAEKVL